MTEINTGHSDEGAVEDVLCTSAQIYDTPEVLIGDSDKEDTIEQSWVRRHRTKLYIGGMAIAFAASIPQLAETTESIKENSQWAIPAIVITEAAWNIGAAVMLVSAGKKIGNPLKIKARIKEATAELKDNKLFRAGLTTNLAGATGTSAIIAVGSVAELPPSTWPSAFLVAGASLAPSVALWKGVYNRSEIEEEN